METLSTKVHTDTKEAVEAYRAEHEISRSEAIRRLITNSLENEDRPDHTVSFATLLMWIGSILATAHYVEATGYAGPVGIALLAGGFVLTRRRVINAISSTLKESPRLTTTVRD